MNLYHYARKGNTVLKDGLLSFAANSEADSGYYKERSGKNTHKGICRWMESCYPGRSRSIRAFTEPIKWSAHNLHCLGDFVNGCDLFEIDVSALDKDGFVEAVRVSPPVTDFPELTEEQYKDEVVRKLENGIADIDFSPVNWDACDDKTHHRFAFVRYYLLTIKGGIIPPEYLRPIK